MHNDHKFAQNERYELCYYLHCTVDPTVFAQGAKNFFLCIVVCGAVSVVVPDFGGIAGFFL